MAPDDETRRSAQSREHDFVGRDLLVGRPEKVGRRGRPTARAARAQPPATSPQPGAHDDAIRELLTTVRAMAVRSTRFGTQPGWSRRQPRRSNARRRR